MDDTDTRSLVYARAVGDPARFPRGTALQWLAGRFADDSEIMALLRDRLLHDPYGDARRRALGWLAFPLEAGARKVALSRDLDGDQPGIDPLAPIDDARVAATAERLQMSAAEARALYEDLARDYPLRLAWQPEIEQRA